MADDWWASSQDFGRSYQVVRKSCLPDYRLPLGFLMTSPLYSNHNWRWITFRPTNRSAFISGCVFTWIFVRNIVCSPMIPGTMWHSTISCVVKDRQTDEQCRQAPNTMAIYYRSVGAIRLSTANKPVQRDVGDQVNETSMETHQVLTARAFIGPD